MELCVVVISARGKRCKILARFRRMLPVELHHHFAHRRVEGHIRCLNLRYNNSAGTGDQGPTGVPSLSQGQGVLHAGRALAESLAVIFFSSRQKQYNSKKKGCYFGRRADDTPRCRCLCSRAVLCWPSAASKLTWREHGADVRYPLRSLLLAGGGRGARHGLGNRVSWHEIHA